MEDPSSQAFRDLNIHPQQLLIRRLAALSHQQLVPVHSGLENDSNPNYSDSFMMYEYKVRRCTRSTFHAWSECPFAHTGEKAHRRCPRRFSYFGIMCQKFHRGRCSREDRCEFAHGVFECWLHPSRYRTVMCKDGTTCRRKFCFFAHTPSELRSLPPPGNMILPMNRFNLAHCANPRCKSGSPSFYPTQPGARFSPISRFSNRMARLESCGMNQFGKEPVNDQAMNMNVVEGPNRNSKITCGYDNQPLFSFPGDGNLGPNNLNEDKFVSENSTVGPDLDWVNDLLT